MEFAISVNWKGDEVKHNPVRITLGPSETGVEVSIQAPFFNDPGNPGGKPGQPFDDLWEYEVVEVFFLDSEKEEYLEAEFCPHGQHQILVLKGCRKAWKTNLILDCYKSRINEESWTGKAILPWGYFPKNIDRMNAFAIHGSGTKREYEALYPAIETHESPNFHRLQYFQTFSIGDGFIEKRRSAEIWQ